MKAIKNITNIIPPDKMRSGVAKLTKDGALLPVVLLEGAVTGGRTYQANKRSGYVEARERFYDESITAVFWLFGIKLFNDLGDAIGKKVLKLPIVKFDVGKDPLRNALGNVMQDLGKISKKTGKKPFSKNMVAGFKFGKIVSSVAISTTLVGWILPKVNMAVTRQVKDHMKAKKDHHKHLPDISIDEFKNKVTQSAVKKNADPGFKGLVPNADMVANLAHNLENHTVYKLLTTDAGIFAGRTINAWNNDDRIEKLFRDISSSFFYLFCIPGTISFLQKHTNFGNIAKLNPATASQVHNVLLDNVVNSKNSNMSAKEFKHMALGTMSDNNKAIFEGLKFNNGVITLKDLVKNLPKDKELLKRAAEMSKLQPTQANIGRVLTKQQVQDVLTEGKLSSPEFLKKAYLEYFGKNLTDKYRYIPMKQINLFRSNIDDYVNTIVDFANSQKENTGVITKEILEKMNRKNLFKSTVFFSAGFVIAAAFLSTLIPKAQYAITRIRTGKNEFPGMEDDGVREKKHHKS